MSDPTLPSSDPDFPAKSLLRCASTLAGKTPPPRVWHWPDWIPSRTVTLVMGDGAGGKTQLALQLSVSTVAGTPWLGQTPKPGRVLFLSAEEDEDELHRRLDQICIGAGLEFEALEGLHLWPLADRDAVLATERSSGQIEPTALWNDLQDLARELKPVLIVLDALADIFGGNENVRAQVRQFVAQLRRLAMQTGAAVVVLAHPSLSGMSTGTGASGSTAWNNSVRSRIYLTKPNDADGDPDARVLSLKKANYTGPQTDMRLRRQATGFVLEGGGGGRSPLDMAVEHRRVDALFLDLLDAYTAQGRFVSDTPSSTYAPAVFARDGLAKGCLKAGFAAAMNRLLHAGYIRSDFFGPPSKQRRRLVRQRERLAD